MPELPEVETTKRGIEPYLEAKRITDIVVRNASLRQPVTANIAECCKGQRILSVSRRGKYLLIATANGNILIHLGMSGSLRVVPAKTPAQKHDHVDLVVGKQAVRLRDPRRFGLFLWSEEELAEHPLLKYLGPEPLDDAFTGEYLWKMSRKRRVAIKNFIMNSHIVVGVGNIYANEALFMCGIRPTRQAGIISRADYERLATNIRRVLEEAIRQGGTTLKDFRNEEGKPGYFAQELQVYGRAGEACSCCGETIRSKVIGQRSSFYCSKCQK
ncbi:bifunctional DNA-formamidopyrimidine glycosylase/DNA-(apurinic or apyrimidinic site) lyase [Solemya velum gill symbiont]|uniref:Formamidopyrimidine-DNA glycosylase n=1 Tax=Solemya velum gill symbiont TaxID=2340 RepID=A0A0B0H3E0_SOVGS|nr:bifunctional DNA-formamidopyrimidine glycosylase/DNA-(apurinic or apyrimidinic site) lyase [Solemya velum gill symbiont]KHF24733.1 DNA-(apurinic or apyrimidinic site) lyase [Solemya velum gill symbiont]OOY34757.1 DNA-formamidopyrimidine glycosylase [Solemya velum gill symbiont]OOY37649.1 DNA-formamidopyrimidine glycosylase [Solemya velum gill symbiont]OOY39339.1 DNA-formamidopyrimidine glycosylase [Solemya velum gill symbiont]OOY44065.1 DNA-formamidopyrimidine glycosylase [Solemya velum gil